MTFRESLASTRFGRGLPDEILDLMAGGTRRIQFSVGQTLIRTDAPADQFFVIESGRAAVAIHVPGHGLKVLETVHSGDVLGWSWLVGKHQWTFDGVGVKAGSALVIDAGPLRSLIEKDPAAALPLVLRVLDVMNERIQSARSRLLNIYGDEDDN